jgi:nitrous oxidase accessory protein NosD
MAMRLIRRQIRVGLLVALALVVGLLIKGQEEELPPRPEPPQVLKVCPEGPPACQYSKIQEAIDAAAPDDLLLIGPGSYQEALVIDKSLRLVATELGQVRLIGNKLGHPTIRIEAKDQRPLQVSLDGFTILSALLLYGEHSCVDDSRGLCPNGISIVGPSDLTLLLHNVQIAWARDGIVCPTEVKADVLNLSLIESRLTANKFYGMRLICEYQEAHLYLEGVEVSGNYWGIDPAGAQTVTMHLSGSRFIGNNAGLNIYNIERAQLTITGSQFLHNDVGLIISVVERGEVRIQGSRFIGNEIGLEIASPPAYDYSPQDAPIIIEGNAFLNNSLYGSKIRSPNRLMIHNNLFQRNRTGLILQMANNFAEVSENIIISNEEWGVALYRYPCVEGFPPGYHMTVFVRGENNEIRDNGEGDLCPEDFNWPPNFRVP